MKVSVIGTTGYGGVELLRILHSHPVFNIQSIHSTRGEDPIWKEYPHLFAINDQVLEGIQPGENCRKSRSCIFSHSIWRVGTTST